MSKLPPAARAIAASVTAAVDAAGQAQPESLREAAADLATLDAEHTKTILGTITRMLLEELHPDGLDSDDIRAVLGDCARGALGWLPELEPNVLLIILAGALGIHPEEQDGVARPGPLALALHAPVLIAFLLTTRAEVGRARSLSAYLSTAFGEIARSELMEAP
jgi:hypothetical protein